MYSEPYDDANYYESQDNLLETIQEQTKQADRGYNVFYKTVVLPNGLTKKKQVAFYTSGNTGNYIRDAETGGYTNYLVGSKDEDLFFKVSESTGKCNSKNGSNTLFYSSPNHYASHLDLYINNNIDVTWWEEKRYKRMEEKKMEKKPRIIVVK